MSKSHSQHTEDNALQSYIIGFFLSLLFTFIPYIMVVNQVVTGTKLLITIVSFAMVQLVIQVTFFLHLGRGPKPKWNLYFFVATVGAVAFVVGGSIFIMSNLHYNMSPSDKVKKIANDEGIYQVGGKETGACQGQNPNHMIMIENGKALPSIIEAKKCDTLTFMNDEQFGSEIAFGQHPYDDVYAGETQIAIKAGKSKTITLSEPGTFSFHDHFQQEVIGSFTVAE